MARPGLKLVTFHTTQVRRRRSDQLSLELTTKINWTKRIGQREVYPNSNKIYNINQLKKIRMSISVIALSNITLSCLFFFSRQQVDIPGYNYIIACYWARAIQAAITSSGPAGERKTTGSPTVRWFLLSISWSNLM